MPGWLWGIACPHALPEWRWHPRTWLLSVRVLREAEGSRREKMPWKRWGPLNLGWKTKLFFKNHLGCHFWPCSVWGSPWTMTTNPAMATSKTFSLLYFLWQGTAINCYWSLRQTGSDALGTCHLHTHEKPFNHTRYMHKICIQSLKQKQYLKGCMWIRSSDSSCWTGALRRDARKKMLFCLTLKEVKSHVI